MKKIFLTLLIAIGFVSFRASAQVSINVNIGSQPLWGPVGYDHADYYYLPDVESYYYVPKKQFIYLDNGRWNFSASLPSRYSGYDLYNGYKVVINSRDAYHNFDNDRVRYAKYKKVKGQKAIKYSDDPRYYVVKGHPHGMPPGQAKKMYSKKNDAGKGKDHGAGKGNGKGKH
ncbi:hypothetical protein FBD94_14895 [Pedobacter hiemivivus]|uniref:WG repeat-containing protein n=1 Tax=Pedobacter hiemivivus TaxID=2530454 RepID=A0A4V5PCF9_9SPHI|nr:hypothetical protein [Pedobacter hiemivivus]TKC60196.1 hypothetical protein FBD94_14895 [Pedobacter hiemivivus]